MSDNRKRKNELGTEVPLTVCDCRKFHVVAIHSYHMPSSFYRMNKFSFGFFTLFTELLLSEPTSQTELADVSPESKHLRQKVDSPKLSQAQPHGLSQLEPITYESPADESPAAFVDFLVNQNVSFDGSAAELPTQTCQKEFEEDFCEWKDKLGDDKRVQLLCTLGNSLVFRGATTGRYFLETEGLCRILGTTREEVLKCFKNTRVATKFDLTGQDAIIDERAKDPEYAAWKTETLANLKRDYPGTNPSLLCI